MTEEKPAPRVRVLSPADLDALVAAEPHGPEYGPWTFHPETMTLELRNDMYEVDLEDCTTSARTLDWIAQVSTKVWATDEVLSWLIRAIDDQLRPQSTLCGQGAERGPVRWFVHGGRMAPIPR